jgi:hypothetical protein
MELFARTLEVRLHKTEMELAYFTCEGSTCKMTDYPSSGDRVIVIAMLWMWSEAG